MIIDDLKPLYGEVENQYQQMARENREAMHRLDQAAIAVICLIGAAAIILIAAAVQWI